MGKHKFDTKVQVLKYNVLKEVARLAWKGQLLENITEIPQKIAPGKIPTMRCCVYKERAILGERVKYAVGGNRFNKKVIQVIDIACDDCPTGGFEVTSVCRGCLAHRCYEACKTDAISFGRDQKAYIDKTKCVECGACAKACQYNAITNYKRPCETSCKVKAISVGENKEAKIDYEKCVSCGACVYACPFGAITDRSYILDVIDILMNKKSKVYALVAPSIASQFIYAKTGQIMTAIKMLGFDGIEEVALGADMVAEKEAAEIEEKGFMTSSCCPAFVSFIEKNFPELKDKISHNLSPAGTIAKYIKEKEPDAKTVFIGPCTAKKFEFQREEYAGTIDSVITFEELQALIDSKDIEVTDLPETEINDASCFGRKFARSGGVSEAVAEMLKEKNSAFTVKPVACNGIEECRIALLRASKGVLPENFIEGMACIGGCAGGAGCLTHGEKNRAEIDKYGASSPKTSISDALKNQNERGRRLTLAPMFSETLFRFFIFGNFFLIFGFFLYVFDFNASAREFDVEIRSRGFVIRVYPKNADAEAQEAEYIPAYEGKVEKEQFPFIAVHDAAALVYAVFPVLIFRILLYKRRHRVGIRFDYSGDNEEKRPKENEEQS